MRVTLRLVDGPNVTPSAGESIRVTLRPLPHGGPDRPGPPPGGPPGARSHLTDSENVVGLERCTPPPGGNRRGLRCTSGAARSSLRERMSSVFTQTELGTEREATLCTASVPGLGHYVPSEVVPNEPIAKRDRTGGARGRRQPRRRDHRLARGSPAYGARSRNVSERGPAAVGVDARGGHPRGTRARGHRPVRLPPGADVIEWGI